MNITSLFAIATALTTVKKRVKYLLADYDTVGGERTLLLLCELFVATMICSESLSEVLKDDKGYISTNVYGDQEKLKVLYSNLLDAAAIEKELSELVSVRLH